MYEISARNCRRLFSLFILRELFSSVTSTLLSVNMRVVNGKTPFSFTRQKSMSEKRCASLCRPRHPCWLLWKLQFNEAMIIAIIRVAMTTTRGRGDGGGKGESNREKKRGLTGGRRGQRCRHEEWFNGAYRASGRRCSAALAPTYSLKSSESL